MTAARFIAACVQMRTGRDPARNRDDAVAMVRDAAGRGAHFVQTPEMTGLLERDRAAFREKLATQDDVTKQTNGLTLNDFTVTVVEPPATT